MTFLFDYALFSAKALTLVILVVLGMALIGALKRKVKDSDGTLEVKSRNQRLQQQVLTLNSQSFSKQAFKAWQKSHKPNKKDNARPRCFVLNFKGDLRASAAASLREEISTIVAAKAEGDQVVVRLENGGGTVHDHGFAASQLARLREHDIPLTVVIDKVAASGGYLMACVANSVVAAPFAIVGSIGVLTQVPNFHRLLQKNGINVEQIQAGEHKRTLTFFGENTDEDRVKTQQDINRVHGLFKHAVTTYRPQLDIDKVATGDIWFGQEAKALGLIDDIGTSDDVLHNLKDSHRLVELNFKIKRVPPVAAFLGKTARSMKALTH